MTSWVMWEIWWSRMWGGSALGQTTEYEYDAEVAHEPSRLPVELIAEGRATRPYPPRPRG
ncbi:MULTISPECIES: hypothetical protein [Aeromonas]|uniref:hypothetical protein n=1 Tax=Aeromonas TaxID=642 RepID=UPI0032ECA799